MQNTLSTEEEEQMNHTLRKTTALLLTAALTA